jgi:hypothetical protein
MDTHTHQQYCFISLKTTPSLKTHAYLKFKHQNTNGIEFPIGNRF